MESSRFGAVLFAVCLIFIGLVSQAEAKDRWINQRTENFNIYSNAGESDAGKLASKLEQFRSLFGRLFNIETRTAQPVPVYAFKSDDAFKKFKPLYNGKPANIAGYFHPGEQMHIALDISSQQENPMATIYHEYTHLITSNSKSQWPTWVSEGIAEFYSTFTSDKKGLTLGNPIVNHILFLRQNQLLPINQLIKVEHDSPIYNERDKQGIFYAESWALVHYLMLGNKHARQGQLVKYLSLVANGKQPEQAFNEAFQTDFATMEKELKKYLSQDVFPNLIVADSTATVQNVTTIQLSEAEAQYQLGFLLMEQRRYDEAAKLFQQALSLDANLVSAYRGLGSIALKQDKYDEARGHYEKALAIDANDWQTHFYCGETYFESMNGQSGDARKAMIDKAIAEYSASIKLNPQSAQAHHQLAFLYLYNDEKITEGRALIDTAVRLKPHNLQYAMTRAQYQIRQDDFDGARKSLAPVLTDSDPNYRTHAQSILNYMAQVEQQLKSQKNDSNNGAASAIEESTEQGTEAINGQSIEPSRPTIRRNGSDKENKAE